MTKPNKKQQMFCREYLVDMNGAKAAVRAGYSERTARSTAYELLQKPSVVAFIDQLQRERVARIQVDADEVLRILFEDVTADLADLYDETNNLKPVDEWPMAWRRGLVAGVDVEKLFEGRGKDRECTGDIVKLRLADRSKLKEMLGKHVRVGAFSDTLKVGPTDEMAELMREISADASG